MANKPFVSQDGYSIGNAPVNIILANGDITTTRITLSDDATSTGGAVVLTGNPNAPASNVGVLQVGPPLGFDDTNILMSMTHSVDGYTQVILQNPNTGGSASADFIVNNDREAGSTVYGDFGINSSNYAVAGAFSDPSGTYLLSSNGSLTVGSISVNDLRLATGNTIRISIAATGNTTISGNANVTGLLTTANVNSANINVGNLTVTGQSVLGSNANITISGGTSGQLLGTDGSGALSWVPAAGVIIQSENFIGDGIETVYTLSATPMGIDYVTVNLSGVTQIRNAAYTLLGNVITFTAPPIDGATIEVTITSAYSGAPITYSPGIGLNLIGTVFNIANTTVTPGEFGTASYIPTITVNQQGQLTAVSGNVVVAPASSLAGTTLNSTIINSSLTTVGTLGLLNVTGNIKSGNADLGNIATANFFSGDGGLLSNIPGSHSIANGTSNVTIITSGGNVTTSVGGTANILVVSTSGANLLGTFDSSGNITSGNVYANSGTVGASLLTGTLTTGAQPNITSVGSLTSLTIVNDFNGNTGNFNGAVYSNADIVAAHQLATKEYVDLSASTGIQIHTPVRVEQHPQLVATYTNGGTTPTVTTIATGNVLTTSAVHGLSPNDMIVFDSTTHGLTGGIAYFVLATPATNQLTLTTTYGSIIEVTGLTNGTLLTITSRANSGVGAKLTNAGTQAALVVDGVTMALTNRVMVYNQVDSTWHGVYTVTNIGSGSTNWEMTRATDADKYVPHSTSGMSVGDYFYIQAGTAAGESYVITAPTGAIILGTTGITLTQFNAAVPYTVLPPLLLDGQTLSIPNVTGSSTFVVLQNSPDLITPNIGVATGNSLTLTGSGNLSAAGKVSFTGANVSLGAVANLKITGGSSDNILSTDGTGNLSWVSAATGSITGRQVYLQNMFYN